MEKIKLLVVDDHTAVRHGVQAMLETQPDKYQFEIDGAENGEEALKKTSENHYDVLIIDYQMPNMSGFEVTKAILHKKPESKIIIFSGYDYYSYITNAMEIGAKGYMLKNIGPEELIYAITHVLNGKIYCCAGVTSKLIEFNKDKSLVSKVEELSKLTEREKKIIRLFAQGYTYQEMADKVFMCKSTIEKDRKNILRKLKLKTTADLIRKAMEWKLYKIL